MIDTSMFWPHQQQTYDFHKDAACGFDGSDAGTAKTLPHLKIAEYFLANGGTRVLVVCPKVLMRSAWLNEAKERVPHLADQMALAEAPASNRKKAFDSDKPIVLINVDAMQWLEKQHKTWLKNRIGNKGLLIIDESHTLKNPDAKRTKAAMRVSEYFVKRHIMSGTASPNSVTELWSQFKIIDGGVRLGQRYTTFRNHMQMPVQKGPWVEWVDKPESAYIINELIKDITIRHEFSTVMKHVPEIEQQVIWYDLPKKHREVYDQLEHDSYLEYENTAVTALNAGILANKLLQLASGAVYHDVTQGKKTWEMVDSGRYELIAELAEARRHSIIFFLWDHQKQELERILKGKHLSYDVLDGKVKGDEKRAGIVSRFQNGELRTLLMHPKTGAYGLTLTKAATIIYASPIYEAAAKIQGDARIRRGTQDQAMESIVVLGKDTRDIHAYQVFSGKLDRLTAMNNLFAG